MTLQVLFVIKSGHQGLRSEQPAAVTEVLLYHCMDSVVGANPAPLGTQMVFCPDRSFSLTVG